MYVGHLVLVFREVRRVLRRDGTLWLNLGDSYARPAAKGQHKPGDSGKQAYVYDRGRGRAAAAADLGRGLKEKDLVGIPWRAAFALEADGWWLRSDIIWHKINALPESVKDRPTKAHEYIFLLAKSLRYFYDAEIIREPDSGLQGGRQRAAFRGTFDYAGRNYKLHLVSYGGNRGLEIAAYTGTRNKRSVWWLSTEPFTESHFATFPRGLVEPCIKAGTSERGCCPKCGAPWERVVNRRRTLDGEPVNLSGWPADGGRRFGPQGVGHWRFATAAETAGWRPTCRCPGNDGSARCVVLDPFGGAGTTALAADALGRDSVYIDLKREYAEMALRRLGAGERLFVEWDLTDLSSEAGGAAAG